MKEFMPMPPDEGPPLPRGLGLRWSGRPIIHEAVTESPDPAELMPVEVTSAFPKGAFSVLSAGEKAKIDEFIEEVPDENDPSAINYWVDMGDKKVYLEGWCDECLAGTGFPPIESGDWDEKIQYMVRKTREVLPRKAKERELSFIEGGFREFEAGDRGWLYGVTWGLYSA